MSAGLGDSDVNRYWVEIFPPEEVRYSPDVSSITEQVGGEVVADGAARDALLDAH